MRLAAIILPILLVLAAPASATERPFDGRWGFDAEACALQPGASDLVPTVIANDEIQYYESHCRIEAVEPIGGEGTSAWRVRLSCSGEGETWTSEEIFAIDYGIDQRRRQLIEIDLEDGFVVVRQACD
jgi:hypothetical protein